MIALLIARKNLSSLFSNPSSFLCKSHVSFFPLIHNFSTSNEKQSVLGSSTTVYDVLVNNHHFSPEFAILAASDLSRRYSPERVDSVVSLFKENMFPIAQIVKVVRYRPRILGFSDEDIELKLKIFRDLGLSSEETAKLISQNPCILHCSARSKIIPALALLKGLLGSDHDVAGVLRKSAWFLFVDLEKSLVPNVEIMKLSSIPMKDICYLMFKFPRCLLKPDVLKKSIDKVKGMGAFQSPRMFILALGVVASFSEEAWELKWQGLRELGFSDSDILEMFKKGPPSFFVSTEKMNKVTELLLATGKFDMSAIANFPSVFGRSIENRLKPRLQLFEILEGKGLATMWPSLSTISTYSDDLFFKNFVKPHSSELGKDILLELMPTDYESGTSSTPLEANF